MSEVVGKKIEERSGLAPGGTKIVPFGVNEVRLNGKQWVVALGILSAVIWLMPRVWQRIERFETGADYRIPYALSKDYWLYARRLRQVVDRNPVVVLGDSVVWGEYVLPDGTLTHFLNREAKETNRFVNGGVNGLFPLALEGLVKYYAPALAHQKVLLHCNVLWMTSPKADLSTEKEEPFNHSRLVPQFSPRIPCYKADANERLNAVMERTVGFLGWVNHIQDCYFAQKSIPKWTLEDDGAEPPRLTNSWRNPVRQIHLTVPPAPEGDPMRGPKSPRHKPWSDGGSGQGTTRFEWVNIESSLQWGAFRRLVRLLRERDNDVFVVLGPFNEYMMTEENRGEYRKIRGGIEAWLSQNGVIFLRPQTLPSALYADASHPLTEGYDLLAKEIFGSGNFKAWSEKR